MDGLLRSQPAGEYVGLVVQFLDDGIDLIPGFVRYAGPIVDDSIDGSNGHVGSAGNFFDADILFVLFHK